MDAPQSLKSLSELLRAARPNIQITTDDSPPVQPNGAWWLTIFLEGKREDVLWLPEHGFGLWYFEPVFTEGPSEFFPLEAIETVCAKVIEMLESTTPKPTD